MDYTINLLTHSSSFNEGQLAWLDPSYLRSILVNATVVSELTKIPMGISENKGPNCLISYEVPEFLINRTCFVPKTQISEAKDIINFCSTFGGTQTSPSPHPLKSFFIGDTFPRVVEAKGYYSSYYYSHYDFTCLAVDKLLQLHTPANTTEGIFYLGNFFQ